MNPSMINENMLNLNEKKLLEEGTTINNNNEPVQKPNCQFYCLLFSILFVTEPHCYLSLEMKKMNKKKITDVVPTAFLNYTI